MAKQNPPLNAPTGKEPEDKVNLTFTPGDSSSDYFGPPEDSDIESLLIPDDELTEESPYFSLEANGGGGIYFNLDSELNQSASKVDNYLEGEEAMKFLGLPVRPLCHMKRGDHSQIQWHFENLFRRWEKKAEREKRVYNRDTLFWKNIIIKVWNKANLESLHPTKGIKGKKTAPCPSLNLEGGEYTGETFDGRSISTFLSETPNSQRWMEYFVQVVGVHVTEDMANAQ